MVKTYLVSDISNRSISTKRPVWERKSLISSSFFSATTSGGVFEITKTTPSCGLIMLSKRWVWAMLVSDASPSGLSRTVISIFNGSSNLYWEIQKIKQLFLKIGFKTLPIIFV